MQTSSLLAVSFALAFATLTPCRLAQAADSNPLRMPPMTYLGASQSPQSFSYGQPSYQPELGLAQPGYSQAAEAGLNKPTFSSLSSFRPQAGLAVQVNGQWSSDALLSLGEAGIGLDLMLRVHPRLTLELGAEYQHGTIINSYSGQYNRTDVPILTGLRVYLGPLGWSAAPYLVAVFGADCAHAQLPAETAWFFEGQGGLGLEGRLGHHFSLNVDLRGFGRVRPSADSALYLTDTYGNLIPVLNNQSGFLFNTGCAFYF